MVYMDLKKKKKISNRKQAVRFGQELSELHNLTCGVPQGSILRLLIFLLTFNIVTSCNQCNLCVI